MKNLIVRFKELDLLKQCALIVLVMASSIQGGMLIDKFKKKIDLDKHFERFAYNTAIRIVRASEEPSEVACKIANDWLRDIKKEMISQGYTSAEISRLNYKELEKAERISKEIFEEDYCS